MAEVRTYLDVEQLVAAATKEIVETAALSIAARGRCSIVLSGGSTPRVLYEALASDHALRQIDWEYVHVFWGDERCVPPDHADSNYRMASEVLLEHVPVSPEHVYPMRGDIDPAQAAAEYEHQLRVFFGTGRAPRFDLVLLGMGADGHTASLFPGAAAIFERVRWVVAHRVSKLDVWRLTLTPVVMNVAAKAMFLVTGERKAECLQAVLLGSFRPDELPSQIVEPTDGSLLWLVDAAAASLLQGE